MKPTTHHRAHEAHESHEAHEGHEARISRMRTSTCVPPRAHLHAGRQECLPHTGRQECLPHTGRQECLPHTFSLSPRVCAAGHTPPGGNNPSCRGRGFLHNNQDGKGNHNR